MSSSPCWKTQRNAVHLAAVLYFALLTTGVTIIPVWGSVTVTGAYFGVFAMGLFFAKTIFTEQQLNLRRPTAIVAVIFTVFTLWVGLATLWGTQPLRGLTLLALTLFGGIIYIRLSTTLWEQALLSYLNVLLFRIASVLAIVGLLLYVPVVLGIIELDAIGQFSNWQIIAIPTQGISLYRYTGFVGAPNVYPWYAGLGFVAGIFSEENHKWRLALFPLALTLLLTMSRTYTAAAILAALVIGGLLQKDSVQYQSSARIVSLIVGSMGSLVLALFLLMPNLVTTWVRKRLFATLLRDKRFISIWPRAFDDIVERPILGHGSRALSEVMSVTAHGAYIGLWYDFGLIGLVLWVAILGYALVVASRASRFNEAAIPWLFAVITTIGINVMNSFQHLLFVWLVVGVALSGAVCQRSDRGHRREAVKWAD